jgi:ATP-binding cassette subfamily F protein 3
MIQLVSLHKFYGKQTLFRDVNVMISAGERVGLIGRNGSGKSTILRMIMGEEEPESGQIILPKDYRVGHLSQHLKFTEPTVLDEAALGLPMQDGGWKETYKAESMLCGLGFSLADQKRSPHSFSGGFQIRINLAKLLLSEPNLLLLDEPTNYLDVVSIRWMQQFLQEWPTELILITHDRAFLDSVTTHSMVIHRERIRKIRGSSVDIMELIAQDEEIYEKTRVNEEKKREQVQRYIDRFKAQATRARSVQSRVKALAKMEVKDQLVAVKNLDFEFNSLPFPGKWLLEVDNVSFRYGEDQPWLIKNLSFALGKKDRLAIIGPNGRGKTTLLKLLAGELQPVNGEVRWNSNTKLSHFGQTNIVRLNLNNTIEQELIATHPDRSRAVARNIAGLMMFEGDAALKKISVISGGERSRVLLGKILIEPTNLLLLDEPTNHLDMESIDTLLEAIEAFPGGVVIVTHSEMILRSLATRLVVFDGDQANIFEGGYDDFLERVGWRDLAMEEEALPVTNSIDRRNDAERRKALDKLERTISTKEEEISKLTEELTAASSSRDVSRIQRLSTQIHGLKEEIDDLFLQLAEIT